MGSMATIAVMALFLFFYVKESRKRRRAKPIPAGAGSGALQPLRRSIRESVRYLLIACALFLFLYLWITPFMPISGKVENKDFRTRGRTVLASTYFIYVDGGKHPVDKDIYDLVQPGDAVGHRVVSQAYYINGQRRIAGQFAWNTAFWGGVLGIAFIALSIGTFCHHFRNARASSPSRGVH